MCDRVGVLYAGELVEEGPARQVFDDPRHPYTVGLLRCIPRRGQRKDRGRLDTIPGFLPAPGAAPDRLHLRRRGARSPRTAAAPRRRRSFDAGDRRGPRAASSTSRRPSCRGPPRQRRPAPGDRTGSAPAASRCGRLSKTFPAGEACTRWPTSTSTVHRGETLGLVGESGSGKTTLARVAARADRARTRARSSPARASWRSPGRAARGRGQVLRALQIVFQNPDSALNRRHSVRQPDQPPADPAGRAVRDGAARTRLDELIASVRLEDRHLALRPAPAVRRAEAAGRDRARVRRRPDGRGLRRADLGARRVGAGGDPQPAGRPAAARSTSPTCSSRHDLGVVRYLSDRIAVLYLGRVMEVGPGRDGVHRAAPPLHRGAAVGGADARRAASANGSG